MKYIMKEEILTPEKTFEKGEKYDESELPINIWEAWIRMQFCKKEVIDLDKRRGINETNNDTSKQPDQTAKRVKTSRLVKSQGGLE